MIRLFTFILICSISFLFIMPVYSQQKYAKIEWEKDPRSEKYLIQISKEENFFTIVHEEIVMENSIQFQLNEKLHENLFGRVSGIGKYDIKGEFSKPFKIKIMVLQKNQTKASEPEKKLLPKENQLDVYYNDTRPFVSNRVQFSLQTNDKESGLKNTFYKLNNNEWQKYSGAFHFSTEGRNILFYYSVDEAGNKEPLKQAEFYLDTTPPKITLKTKGFINREGVQFSGKNSFIQIDASDDGSDIKSFEYSFKSDIENVENFTATKSMDLKIPEKYSNQRLLLTLRATDNLGNQSIKQFYFFHDIEPPKIETDIPIGKEYFKLGSKIKIMANETQSGLKWIKYSLNGKNEEFYADSIEFLQEGKQHIKIIAEDNSGNISIKEISTIHVLSPKIFNIKIKMP